MANSIVVDFGPPPSVSAMENEEMQIRNTTAKIPGILDFNMGSSIKKNRFFLLKFKLSASLNCSVGIFCQPCIISLETIGRLKKILAIIMPCKPYIERVLNPSGSKMLFKRPFLPNIEIIPKIATTVGSINGAPRIVINSDLPQKDCLIRALAENIPKIELINVDTNA